MPGLLDRGSKGIPDVSTRNLEFPFCDETHGSVSPLQGWADGLLLDGGLLVLCTEDIDVLILDYFAIASE